MGKVDCAVNGIHDPFNRVLRGWLMPCFFFGEDVRIREMMLNGSNSDFLAFDIQLKFYIVLKGLNDVAPPVPVLHGVLSGQPHGLYGTSEKRIDVGDC